MGDFNADCSYLSASRFAMLSLVTDERFVWLVDDVTTTTEGSDCAYDKLVPEVPYVSLVPRSTSLFVTVFTFKAATKILGMKLSYICLHVTHCLALLSVHGAYTDQEGLCLAWCHVYMLNSRNTDVQSPIYSAECCSE